MFREDFVMRHIRLFVQVIAQIMGLIETGDRETALELISTSFRDYLGMEMDAILNVPDEQLLDFMTLGELGSNAVDKCGFAVALLHRAGQIYRAKGQSERAGPYSHKALSLLLELLLRQEADPEMPAYSPAVNELLDEIAIRDLPVDSLAGLVFYFERGGEYARAEKILDILLEASAADDESIELARSFYEYLEAESDDALQAGGFSRQKIQNGLQRLDRVSTRADTSSGGGIATGSKN